jgi:hypothetical protein
MGTLERKKGVAHKTDGTWLEKFLSATTFLNLKMETIECGVSTIVG